MELAPNGYEGFSQFILDLQVFKTAIMSYNVNRNKDSFYKNLETLSKNIVKVKVHKRHSRYDTLLLIKPLTDLEAFEPLEDKQIIYEDRFLELTHNIFETIIYNFALSITDIGDYVERLKTSLNRIFVDNYFIIDCDKIRDKVYSYEDSTLTYYTYNCGRAFMQINENGGKSRFLIFNTNNDAVPDSFIMNKYNKTEEFFLDTTLSIKSTESVKIKESKEYLDFIEIFSTMVKRFIVDFYLKNALFSIVKGTKYDAVYKIPATASKYLVKGFYNNNEGKHFTLGIYEQRGELLTDLIIDDVVIEESLHPIGMVKFLKERGL